MSLVKTYSIEYADPNKIILPNQEEIISIRGVYITTIPITIYELHDVHVILKGEKDTHLIRAWDITNVSQSGFPVYHFFLKNTAPRLLHGRTEVFVTGWNTVTPPVERILIETLTLDRKLL
jgi:hypothetical protein